MRSRGFAKVIDPAMKDQAIKEFFKRSKENDYEVAMFKIYLVNKLI
jgi:hypothetical protein